MITLPESFNGQDFATLMNQQGFNVATWTGAAYAVYPNAPSKNFQAGRGYFVKATTPVTLNVPAQTNTGVRQIMLNSGWNMVGSPFSTSIPLSNLRIRFNNQELTLEQAVSQNLVDANIWGLTGRTYARASSLEMGKGYWVRAHRAVTLVLLPPTTATASAAPAPSLLRLATRSLAAGRPDRLSDWWADLTRRKDESL